jgi:GR25 family glycosyltransferase involved in LPS biosynthesis
MQTQAMNFQFTARNSFCINLNSKPERWARMQARASPLGLKLTRWPASTPETLKDTFVHYLTNGQKGCAQSHMNVWRHIVRNKIPYALVLEDDAMFMRDWKERLPTELPVGWHMLVLNASEPATPLWTWVSATEQYLTGGYIISLEGAKEVIAMFEGNVHASDWMTRSLETLGRSYTYFPWLIIQEGLDTTIGSSVDLDHAKVVRCLREVDFSLENYV